MKETPASISAWSVESFGTVPRQAVAVRCLAEAAELLQACYSYSTEKDHKRREQFRKEVIKEAADVYIMCVQMQDLTDNIPFLVESRPARENWTLQVACVCLCKDMTSFLGMVTANEKCGGYFLDSVFQILGLLCRKVGEDLQTHVDHKMSINRARVWGVSETGAVRHIS